MLRETHGQIPRRGPPNAKISRTLSSACRPCMDEFGNGQRRYLVGARRLYQLRHRHCGHRSQSLGRHRRALGTYLCQRHHRGPRHAGTRARHPGAARPRLDRRRCAQAPRNVGADDPDVRRPTEESPAHTAGLFFWRRRRGDCRTPHLTAKAKYRRSPAKKRLAEVSSMVPAAATPRRFGDAGGSIDAP